MRHLTIAITLAFSLSLSSATAETTTRNGGDTFIGGETVLMELDASGDTFVAAQSATTGGMTLGDLHVTGFDVSVRSDVAEDLYAMGATVDIRAAVRGDTSAAGFSVRTSPEAETTGNVRLAGNTVSIEGPVGGALSVTGRTVILDAPISGDVRIVANALRFGEQARVDGILSYSTPERTVVPESVASADRVQFSRLDMGQWTDFADGWPTGEMPVMPTVASLFGAFVVSLLFFLVLGALALGFAPRQLERLRTGLATAPARSMLLGVVGLSLLFGLVPITGMTIVGIPFIPIVILAIIVVWTLGYALGGYTVAMYVWRALGGSENPGSVVRLLLLAAAVTTFALLNFIPFLGWLANFVLVLAGIGAIAGLLFARFITDPDPALDVDMKPQPE